MHNISDIPIKTKSTVNLSHDHRKSRLLQNFYLQSQQRGYLDNKQTNKTVNTNDFQSTDNRTALYQKEQALLKDHSSQLQGVSEKIRGRQAQITQKVAEMRDITDRDYVSMRQASEMKREVNTQIKVLNQVVKQYKDYKTKLAKKKGILDEVVQMIGSQKNNKLMANFQVYQLYQQYKLIPSHSPHTLLHMLEERTSEDQDQWQS